MKSFLAFSFCLLVLVSSAQKKKTILIGDRLVNCGSRECLPIKEKKKEAWNTRYQIDSILKFSYEEGYAYKLQVALINGGEELKLVKIISKKKTGYNPATKLEGKKWVLGSMFDGSQTLGLKDSTIYLNLDVANGRLSGHGICNNLKGTLKGEGKSISFSEMAYTKMKCIEQGNIIETIITGMLEGITTYQVKGSQLTFYNNKGGYMVFAAH